jgi:hypothetical protein
MTADELAHAVGAEASIELDAALAKIKHCVGQLNNEQIWWRSHPALNAIGNLILHLGGNLRQWIVAGIGGAPNQRNRPAEFAQRGAISKKDLMAGLESVVEESKDSLGGLTAAEALRVRRIQGFDVTALAAIFHTVPHFRGHTQEIVHLTRLQLGERYVVEWQPQTPEQGRSEE